MRIGPGILVVIWVGQAILLGPRLWAAEVFMKNGMHFSGQIARVKDLNSNPLAIKAGPSLPIILLIDDGLRRTFVAVNNTSSIAADIPPPEAIPIPHEPVARQGRAISSVGAVLSTEPFDRWGRRRVQLMTPDGRVDVIQAITEISPVYMKVQGLATERSFQWDCRLATSSLPRAKLSEILLEALDQEDPVQRLAIVRLYLQAERYEEAIAELESAMRHFPKLVELEQQLREIKSRSAQRLLDELKLRQTAGQYQFVSGLLEKFPTENVPLQILAEVTELQDQYRDSARQIEDVRNRLKQDLQRLDEGLRMRLEPMMQDMAAKLSVTNLNRMADYLRLGSVNEAAEQNLAYAISGWVLGAGSATANSEVAFSLVAVRRLVREYLVTGPDDDAKRAEILDEMRGLEGTDPKSVARILKAMEPPLHGAPVAENSDGKTNLAVRSLDVPGCFHVKAPSVDGEGPLEYVIQLPPEYDPYRLYPTIISLHGVSRLPALQHARLQVDWWAGTYDAQRVMRMGQATRHGYIVIAPLWAKAGQRRYQYSAREHATVLFSLTDACQRCSIDLNRVFLSGHGAGGDAAWDIALAHPDRWAGAIMIGAVASYEHARAPEYVLHYSQNARSVPLYFVGGEKDGDKLRRNASQFERYFTQPRCDATVVEYKGRGNEHFQEEIHRLFQWMGWQRREPYVSEFECASMRPLDNSYWWAELHNLPPRAMVSEFDWPKPRGARAATISGRVKKDLNSIWLKSGAKHSTVWLNPEMVNFEAPVAVYFDGRRGQKELISPATETLLEDARTRCDRQHTFWAKVELNLSG